MQTSERKERHRRGDRECPEEVCPECSRKSQEARVAGSGKEGHSRRANSFLQCVCVWGGDLRGLLGHSKSFDFHTERDGSHALSGLAQ